MTQPQPAEPAPADPLWTAFQAVNERRRAIRDFAPAPVSDDDVRAVLAEALLAPSSGNLQPYQIHWVRDPRTRAAVAAACNGQRAAASAPTLLVVVASTAIARRTAKAQLAHVESTPALDAKARSYHRGQLRTFRRFLAIAPLLVWTPLHMLMSLLAPVLTLLPIGPGAHRHWAARSGIYAAQTILLAAVARGLDACPMEGFSPTKVARALGLSRGHVIPIVIALGHRSDRARVEPRWRRPVDDAVVVHGVRPGADRRRREGREGQAPGE
jgi:nitroreductase